LQLLRRLDCASYCNYCAIVAIVALVELLAICWAADLKMNLSAFWDICFHSPLGVYCFCCGDSCGEYILSSATSEEIRRRGHQWAAREAAHKNKQARTQKNTEKQPS
jgi:hypothetical protein